MKTAAFANKRGRLFKTLFDKSKPIRVFCGSVFGFLIT